MQKLTRRRLRVATAGLLSGAILAAMAMAGPAGASTTTAKNNLIIGSGSSTTYDMMQALDTLFNDSLGCYMTQPSGTTQTLDFSCASVNAGNQVGQGYDENPINDVAVEEPALGSSAGIAQLEYGGSGDDGDPGVGGTPDPAAPVNFARSSRALKSSDYPGLNFVAYATDGVSWLSFPKVNGKATPSAKVKNLTVAQLEGIWNGSINNWDKVGGGNASICVYTAQLSSGTEATWATALGFSSPATLNAYVDSITTAAEVPKGCATPKGVSYANSHTIFENEGQDIVENGDEANAIFFFSYGKYQVVCGTTPTARCADNKSKTTTYLGEVNGVTATPTTILCSPCTVAFPITRNLYNIYSNGSFASNAEYGFPAATPATINYVSEIGFLCKPQINSKGHGVNDPSTGVWYRTEINDVIKAQGFIPFPLQTSGENVGTIDTPATAVLKAAGDTTYSPDDPIQGNGTVKNEAISNPEGFCKVYTTDGNAVP